MSNTSVCPTRDLSAAASTAPAATRRLDLRVSDLWAAPLTDLPVRDELIDQFVPLSPRMTLLEVGPGCGFQTFRLARSVGRLTVLDVAAPNIARLEKLFAGQDHVHFVCADLCRPGLAKEVSARFQTIVAIEVLEFVPDPAAALANLGGLLSPGGMLSMQFPNKPNSGGPTYFGTRAELDSTLAKAGFARWEVYGLRLRPWAQKVFRWLHEKPLNLYRGRQRSHDRRPDQPQVYQDTWAFRHGGRMERFKFFIHCYWAASMLLMRVAGEAFERFPAGDEILGKNLFVAAWTPESERKKP